MAREHPSERITSECRGDIHVEGIHSGEKRTSAGQESIREATAHPRGRSASTWQEYIRVAGAHPRGRSTSAWQEHIRGARANPRGTSTSACLEKTRAASEQHCGDTGSPRIVHIHVLIRHSPGQSQPATQKPILRATIQLSYSYPPQFLTSTPAAKPYALCDASF